MKFDEAAIKDLHGTYCRMTGMEIPLTFQCRFMWERWMVEHFTVDDLRLVIEVLRRKIKTGPKTVACLKFTNLIGNTQNFHEDLSEARAGARTPKIEQGKADVLKATHRPTQAPQRACRSAEELIRDSEAFKQFQALKETL